jgi:hypothetical protein
MAAPRLAKKLSNLKRRTDGRLKKRADQNLRPLLELLEDRRLMALGPTLVSVIPNSGVFLNNNDTLNVAPRDLTFRFAQGNSIDPATLATGIKLVRAGIDHQLNTADDVTVTPGYLNLGDTSREVVMRFAATLPDDLYRITLVGAGLTPLKDSSGVAFNGGLDQLINFNLDLGTKIDAIVPQPVTRGANNILVQNNKTIEVYFDQDQLSPTDVTKATFYHLIDATTGSITLPQGVTRTIDPVTKQVKATLTFAADIPAGTFKLEIGVTTEPGSGALDKIGSAQHIGNSMVDGLGNPKPIQSFLGDALAPAGGLQGNDVDYYRFDLKDQVNNFSVNVTPAAGLDAVVRIFDGSGAQVLGQLINNAGPGAAETTPAGGIPLSAGTYYVGVSSANNAGYDAATGAGSAGGNSTGAYSIAVTFGDLLGPTDDTFISPNNAGNIDNSSFLTASDVGTLGSAGRTLTGDILPSPDPTQTYNINLPGSGDAPGDRSVPYLGESYLQTPVGQAPDPTAGVETITYDFQSFYGYTPQGAPLLNAITEDQKQRAREIFELLSQKTGMQFHEVDPNEDGSVPALLSIVTGDLRTLNPNSTTQGNGNGWGFPVIPTLQLGNAKNTLLTHAFVVMNANFVWGNSEFGGNWFVNAIQGITSATGITQHRDLPDLTPQNPNSPTERVFPTDADVVLEQALHRPESNDIDLYKFKVDDASGGLFRAETIAERMPTSTPDNPNLLNTVLTLYKETIVNGIKVRTEVARNDDYYGNDSYLELHLNQGTYYVAVTSTGNTEFNPEILDTGFGGRTQGAYNLSMSLKPDSGTTSMKDATSSQPAFDGDADGQPGGTYQFWFQSNTPAATSSIIYVDKASTVAGNGTGALNNPFKNLSDAITKANADANDPVNPKKLVVIRIEGNGGTDGNVITLADNKPYLVGFKDANLLQALPDGGNFLVPKNVNVMIDAGAVIKMRRTNLNAGTTPQGLVSLSSGAIQVLGTPLTAVQFTSYNDDTIGGDSDGPSTGPHGGDYGGLVFRDDSDHERDFLSAAGSSANPLGLTIPVFLNYVNHAAMNYGGGKVTVDSVEDTYDPIFVNTARPTISYNTIQQSANAAISANPNAFDDDGLAPSIDFNTRRIGPDIHDNTVINNSINGLFIRVRTQAGTPLDLVDLTTRWKATDIVYVVSENVLIAGTPGGSIFPGTASSTANQPPITTIIEDGRLRIDPGVIVKLSGARIETKIGSQFIAEGTAALPIVFTSLKDDRYGAGGTFDTNKDGSLTAGAPGQWGGLYFGPGSSASLDRTAIFYAGGVVPIEGDFASFNAVEIHQADVRLANSLLQFNAGGGAGVGNDRNGRGTNSDAVIFVRGAQPIIVSNILRDNSADSTGTLNATGPVISINANAMVSTMQADYGRSTSTPSSDSLTPFRFIQFDDNHGPLVRSNRLSNNTLNGLEVRGETLTTETVWDDVDIAHVLRSEITALNLHVYGGLRLESSPTQSLIVKLQGANAGFTADGVPLDISDRIGGTVQIIGQPGHPVVLTSLADDSIPAGFDPGGLPVFDTNNNGSTTTTQAGDWRSISLNTLSNDTNLSEILEAEPAYVGVDGSLDNNRTPQRAQVLGSLAPNDKSGDDNRRLGFQVDGTIAMDNPRDVDIYSFNADSGTEVWFDVDRTAADLNAMLELVDANGNVLASATDTDPNNPIVTPIAAPIVTEVVPGSATANEVQSVRLATPPGTSAYTFVLSFNNVKTGPISSSATGADIRAALLAMPGSPGPFGATDVLVTGNSGGPWQVTFQGNYANQNVALLNAGSALPGLNVNVPAGQIGLAQSFDKNFFDGRDTYSTNSGTSVVVQSGVVTGATIGSPIEITSPQHGLASGDRVQISGVVGNTDANGVFTVTVVDQDRFSLNGSFGFSNYVSGGVWSKLVDTTRDPIMRVVLPNAANGTPLKNSPWFIRVRSEPASFAGESGNSLNPGLTSGQYQLQVRIQQEDQKPGSTVRFSDIHYATNGIEVHGLPSHTPLAGETAEANDNGNATQSGAQFLGNALTVDKNTISVGGQIANINDVDWYQFDLNADLTTFYASGFNTWASIFDIDYADGIARPDTTISVFDQSGALIYIGRNGSPTSDLPAAGQGANADDLSRGSFGQQDPYVGTVQLPAGKTGSRTRTYFVAVSTDRSIPTTLNQTFLTSVGDQTVRLEPVDSIGRIVSEHLDQSGGETANLAQNQYVDSSGAVRSNFFDLANKQTLSSSIVPFNLSDVPLFLSQAVPGTTRTDLLLVNPSTGVQDLSVGTLDSGTVGVDDITMRGDGTLWAYESVGTPGADMGLAGRLYQVDAAAQGNATLSLYGSDAIPDATVPPTVPPTIQSVQGVTTDQIGAVAWGGNSINPNQNSEFLYYAINNPQSGASAL